MKKLLLGAALLSTTGCATAYKVTFAAGATTKEFVTTEYQKYSKEFNERLADCDPDQNPESTVSTPEELDACMGDGYTYEEQLQITQGIAAYRAGAKWLSAALLQKDQKSNVLWQAWWQAAEAAYQALVLFPEGEEKVEKLQQLIPVRAR